MSNDLFKELEQMIREGNIKKLKKILNKDNINIKNERGFTLLINNFYKLSQNSKLLKLLLEKGIDVNVQAYVSQGGAFEIMHSAGSKCNTDNEPEVLKLLIEYGLDVNEANKKGYTLLMGAAANGNNEIFDILIEEGADINAVSKEGHFVLGNAAVAEADNLYPLKILIKKGVDVNFVPEGGESALMKASLYANTAIMKMLIANGADVNYADDKGKKILDYLQENYKYYNENGYYDRANKFRNAMLLLQSAGATN